MFAVILTPLNTLYICTYLLQLLVYVKFASSFLRTLRLIIFATRQLPRTARVIRLAAVAVRSMSSVGRGMSEADAVLLVQ
jgi:hypothetical protein